MTVKRRPEEEAGEQTVRPGLVTAMFDRVRLIKRKHPDISRRIDGLENEIREKLMSIKDAIDEFPSMEKELVTVLVINGVHKMCDEILIDSDEAEA
jgi:hypothetical protein